jgi:homopolymeric O-antigen transport system permease protein
MRAIANPLQPHPALALALFGSLRRNRELILQLARRDVLSRYRGSMLGATP